MKERLYIVFTVFIQSTEGNDSVTCRNEAELFKFIVNIAMSHDIYKFTVLREI